MPRPIIEVRIPLAEVAKKYRIANQVIQVGEIIVRVQVLSTPEGVEVTTEAIVDAGIDHPVGPVPFVVLLRSPHQDKDNSFQEFIREKVPEGFSRILLDPPF